MARWTLRRGSVQGLAREERRASGYAAQPTARPLAANSFRRGRRRRSALRMLAWKWISEIGDAPASSRFRVGGEQVVEASRKHGPFDTRWRSAREDNARAVTTAPPLRAAEAAEALDWEAFSNRYFGGGDATTWKR